MIVLIDNYDSFTYNLVQRLGEIDPGVDLLVVRNDQVSLDEIEAKRPTHLIISPGPCTPNESGISLEAARRLPQARLPTLGVCLGHQALVQAWGGRVVQHEPVHGKTALLEHDGQTIFTGLPSPLEVGRYHSLLADPALPQCLECTATAQDVVMAVRHRELPAEGVQFHPESILTEHGRRLMGNFLGDG